MKRTFKNGIMIAIVVMMGGLVFLTMNYAKNHVNTFENQIEQGINEEKPPEKPSTTEEYEDSDMSSHSPNDSDESKDEMKQLPEKSVDENMSHMDKINAKVDLPYAYYVTFMIEGLIISGCTVYLILSRLNKKSLKETFVNIDKVIIYILAIIILTTGLTYTNGFITKSYFLNQSDNIPRKIDNGMSNDSISYSSVKTIKEDTLINDGKFSSTKEDENAVLVSGNIEANLSNMIVTKTGSSSGGDQTSFYGINSALLAKEGAQLTLKNMTITTDATGANGVFSYGGSSTTNNSTSNYTIVTISDSKITTLKDNSGGIMTTGGGITNASNLIINTAGTSSAAIRTDRGGGVVAVDGGTYTTTGQGSPTIYSTADVSVKNATLVAKASEGIIIEGENSVTIQNCNLTDNNTKLNGQSTTYKNIFLYQSMSGDAAEGHAKFAATNSTITTNNGDSFYVTNTTATLYLENNKIIHNDTQGNFLRVQKDSWGHEGENGGNVILSMVQQKAVGNIVIDSISTLDMLMESNSYYEGIINGDKSAQSISLTLDKTSKIKLMGDSYVTLFNNSDSTNSNIDFNGYKLYVNGRAIN